MRWESKCRGEDVEAKTQAILFKKMALNTRAGRSMSAGEAAHFGVERVLVCFYGLRAES